MTTIILHGYLRDLHPDPIEVEANSAAEAISALQLIPALAGELGEKRHHVVVEGFASRDALYDRRPIKTLNIRPVMQGSGRAGVGQIIIGVALIVVGVLTAPAGGFAGISTGAFYLSGAMMVLGGVLQLLAPQPKLDTNEKSRYLGTGKNTVAIGTRIPMIYGRVKAYGHYISFDIDAGRFDGAPASWYSSPYTDYGSLTYSSTEPDIPVPPPEQVDKVATSVYQGLAYPESMVEEWVTFVTFAPVVLLAGNYDISFANGVNLHVENTTAGTTSRVILKGGEINNMPPVGTPITFTRNHG